MLPFLPVPAAFLAVRDDPAAVPPALGRTDLPRAVWKELRPLGHEMVLWREAAVLLHRRAARNKLPAELAAFLQHWLPPEPPPAPPEGFWLLLADTGDRLTLVRAALPLVADGRWNALLRLPALRGLWGADLRASHLEHLWKVLPGAWLLDDAPVPPGAVIGGLGIPAWPDLAGLMESGRRFELQIAGGPAAPADWAAVAAVLPDRNSVLAESPPATGWLLARYQNDEQGVCLKEVFVTDADGVKRAAE